MHLLESLSTRLTCTPVINEVAAGIAAEYFNEVSTSKKAFALVTAGPGLTNIVTAIAGAYLESRELLVIGGQVKTADLARGAVRQRGIQEIDGVAIATPICVESKLVEAPLDFEQFSHLIKRSSSSRKGPVFLEMPLDVQARSVDFKKNQLRMEQSDCLPKVDDTVISDIANRIRQAKRPVFLIGGGVSRETAARLRDTLARIGVPVATTWNAADRLPADHPVYVGRPNTWGQRSANLILQQADILVALGTRLGLQQTGFNWQEFIPEGKVVQVDIDRSELTKGHPVVDFGIVADANDFLFRLTAVELGAHSEWLEYVRSVRNSIPRVEPVNTTGSGYISPYVLVDRLSELTASDDIVIPCSSGGAFTVMMQIFSQKDGQLMVTNKGLASMGYGLSGAIGAAFAYPERRVVLVEGDGGFAQNLQEIGTASINSLNLKMFIFDDSGYASIRMTQRNYFGGRYVGCDRATGLGLPNWEKLFRAWDVPVIRISEGFHESEEFAGLFNSPGPAAFIVSIDPEQTYFPKITSRVTDSGNMESNPLHRMTPELAPALLGQVSKFIKQ